MKKILNYDMLVPLGKLMAIEMEKQTGLKVVYLKEKEGFVFLAPKSKTQIVLEVFFMFIENGEIILDERRLPSVKPWVFEVVRKSYKKYRNKV